MNREDQTGVVALNELLRPVCLQEAIFESAMNRCLDNGLDSDEAFERAMELAKAVVKLVKAGSPLPSAMAAVNAKWRGKNRPR